MRRFQAVDKTLIDPSRYSSVGWNWGVWDWKTQKLHPDSPCAMSRYEARKYARFLNKHQWIIKPLLKGCP